MKAPLVIALVNKFESFFISSDESRQYEDFVGGVAYIEEAKKAGRKRYFPQAADLVTRDDAAEQRLLKKESLWPKAVSFVADSWLVY